MIGMPTPLQPLDIQNPDNEALLFSSAGGQASGNTIRTRYTPVRFAVICLIDQIQREHAAKRARDYRAAMIAFQAEEQERGDAPDRHPRA